MGTVPVTAVPKAADSGKTLPIVLVLDGCGRS